MACKAILSMKSATAAEIADGLAQAFHIRLDEALAGGGERNTHQRFEPLYFPGLREFKSIPHGRDNPGEEKKLESFGITSRFLIFANRLMTTGRSRLH